MRNLVLKLLLLILLISIMGQSGITCRECVELLVIITNPANGATVSDMVELRATVAGSLASNVRNVEFIITNPSILPHHTYAYPPSYSVDWDTTVFPNGTYSIKAKAYTSDGRTAESPTITVTVNNDIKWTFMVYINGDNDLEDEALDDLNEMKSVGSSNRLNIIVQLDKYGDDDPGCWRYKVNYNELQLLQTLPEQDSGDPNVLLDFVNWAMTNYPASRYVLVIWDHGGGWRRKTEEVIKGVSYDYSSGTFIDMIELDTVLSQINRPIHIIGMDACLMQMEEVAYQIIGKGYSLVASEEVIPGDGWPYNTILRELKNNPNMDILDFAEIIVVNYIGFYMGKREVTLSSRRLWAREVGYAANDLARAIRSNREYWSTVRAIINTTQRYYSSDFKDLYDFARRLKEANVPSSIKNAAQAVMTAINNTVTVEGHIGSSVENSHGISIWLPDASQFNSGKASYSRLAFAQNTEWDEMLDDLY